MKYIISGNFSNNLVSQSGRRSKSVLTPNTCEVRIYCSINLAATRLCSCIKLYKTGAQILNATGTGIAACMLAGPENIVFNTK